MQFSHSNLKPVDSLMNIGTTKDEKYLRILEKAGHVKITGFWYWKRAHMRTAQAPGLSLIINLRLSFHVEIWRQHVTMNLYNQ